MADTLKFGPEWLHALSQGGNVTSPPSSPGITKYKLANHRYGREEMLILYNKGIIQKPESLNEFSAITLEKCQMPLAFVPLTDEEQKNWSRSVNSDVVLRLAGRGSSTSGLPGIRPGGVAAGRGSSVDRGRGRGRGSYYTRNIGEDPGLDRDIGPRTNRGYERSHSLHDRNPMWDEKDRKFEKNFNVRGNEENGLLSRKDNWRSERDEIEEDSGWRNKLKNEKWSRGSWRNYPDEKSTEFSQKHDTRLLNKQNRFHDMHGIKDSDHLPEWSREDDFDYVGSFDSSGAFRENQPQNKKDPFRQKFFENEEYSSKTKQSVTDKKDVDANHSNHLNNTQLKSHSYDQNHVTNNNNEDDDDKANIQCVSSSSSSLSSNSSSSDAKEAENENNSLSNQELDRSSVMNNVPKSDVSSRKKPKGYEIKPKENVNTEENFEHLEKAAETMMEKWTAEEEVNVPQVSQKQNDTVQINNKEASPLSLQQENALKWLYRDPQGEIQGPFLSEEMFDWFNAGYFSMNLLVRRGCDDRFLQLGELMKMWGRCPFSEGQQPPPIKVVSNPIKEVPSTTVPTVPAVPESNNMVAQEELMRAMQVQMMQHQWAQEQQQFIIRNYAQGLNVMKQTEGFDLMNPQQQQQLVMQYLLVQQQQQAQRSTQSLPEIPQASRESMQHLLSRLNSSHPPPAGLWPGVNRQAQSVWDLESRSQSEPVQQNTAAIISNIEELQRREKERMAKDQREQEERRLAEAEHLRIEEEKRLELKRQEELKKKHEEELIRQEEERQRKEDLRRQEEERLRQEELRKIKEAEEKKKREQEQLRRLEELRKKEELRRKEEMRQQEELKRQEELKAEEDRKNIEIERRKELERIKELERQEEIERNKAMAREFEENQQAILRMQEQHKQKSQGSAWGTTNSTNANITPSLAEIQKLQEEREQRERIEREKLMQLQQQQLASYQQQQQQQQQMKSNLTWAHSVKVKNEDPYIKSLAEIQKEEERVSKQQKELAKQKVVTTNLPLTTAGVWGNASSQLVWNQVENHKNDENSSGFWDEPKKKTPSKKSGEQNYPNIGNSSKTNQKKTGNQINKNKSRSKKEEENVLKLFESQSEKTDEFTTWCTKALSSLNHSVDVPTFIGFLKDIESPFEVQDYVKSFLGEGKESKDFAKQFLERRSKQRNHMNSSHEENMWGPAPAIMPNQNKSSNLDGDGYRNNNSSKKKKKGKMQKLDSSVLGFTVYADPTRINVGEIDHGDVTQNK